MTRAEDFERLRPLLFAIAYRILGSVAEAEDAVQETWLRCESSPAQPTSAKSFLSAVVTRISIDVLRSARVRREEYVGPWFPEPLLTDPYEDPERSAELADSVSMAALLGVVGTDNVARVLMSIFPVLAKIDARVEPREVNGQPGAILRDRDGKVVGTLTLDVLGGRIQTIRSVMGQRHLQCVLAEYIGHCSTGRATAP